VSAQISEIRCDGHLEVILRPARMTLSVMLELVGGQLEIQVEDGRGHLPSNTPRPLTLVPADIEAHGHSDNISFIRHLTLEFDRPVLAEMWADDTSLTDAFAPRPAFSHPGIMHLAKFLADECTTLEPHSRLYGDTLSIALLLALSKLNGSTCEPIARGRLAPCQLRRVTQYVDAHLAEEIQLKTLADMVGLSRSHFSRAFKVSTGLAPHRWQLQARIAKAKRLLLESDHPIAQIAIDTGFADQAHFTRTFGRAAGESPRAWQRARSAA
jgi:AraC family transcriptional regulator